MFHHVSRLSIFLAVVATSQPVLASDPDSMVLEPSSQWQLDYGDTRCRIGRIFGEGETETALYLEQVEPSESLHWIVGGGIVPRLGSKFTTQFGPGFDPYITRSDIGLTISGFGDAVRGTGFEDSESNAESDEEEPIGLPHLDPNEGASVEWVRLSRGNRSYQLKLGNLKPVYEAMNTCMVNLVTYWGGDPELLRKRKTAPILTNLNLVAMQIQRHYPSQALSRGAQADLLIRAMVEADGTVSKCHITSLTQADLFDTEACRVMLKDAKFEPATDMDGRPMASYAIQRVLYRMSSNR